MGVIEDEQANAIAELAAAVRKWRDSKTAIMAAISRCRAARISMQNIAAVIGVNRTTTNTWVKNGKMP